MGFDVTDFQQDVIARSTEVPVLVDFWAPWCGPCRMLGPILEKLATEADGTWTLAKINTDQQPQVSAQYGIRGIPAVKLFVDGEVVDEFTGALPEHAVRQWLDKALPNENKARVAQAEQALAEGDDARARMLLEEVLADDPKNVQAPILMARLLAFEDPIRAEQLIDGAAFAGPSFVQIAEAVRTLAQLHREQNDPDLLPEGDGAEAYRAALDAVVAQNFDTALERFIVVIQTDRYYHDDAARKACLALFALLGEQHPTVRKHRRRFDMALY